MKESAWISPARPAHAKVTRKTVFRVSNSKEIEIIGSKGALVKALRTKARSQAGVLKRSAGHEMRKF